MALGRKREQVWDGKERRAPATVLVVNDDPGACELLVRMIATAGYRTAGALSETEATSTIARHAARRSGSLRFGHRRNDRSSPTTCDRSRCFRYRSMRKLHSDRRRRGRRF